MSKRKKRGVFVAGYWLDERLLIRVDIEGKPVADFEIEVDEKNPAYALEAFSALVPVVGLQEPAPKEDGMFFFMSSWMHESYFEQIARELKQLGNKAVSPASREKMRLRPKKARKS